MKGLVVLAVERLLDPNEKRVPAIVLQGVVACLVGLGMVTTDYVKRGFRWPNGER